MNTPARYLLTALAIIISLHYILSFTHQEYGKATSISNIASHFRDSTPIDHPAVGDEYYCGNAGNSSVLAKDRANATFVILARNSDLDGIIQSIRDVEYHFNQYYHYPYVFLNDVPFSDTFKRRIENILSGTVEFGTIPHEHWVQPDWIDEKKAEDSRNNMVKNGVIYGGIYRNMCRFNSGFFFQHELLQKYRWYWRIEPDVHFHCDVSFDPFRYMEENHKVYAFTIAIYEFKATIPTLWDHVKQFIKDHPEHVVSENSMGFLSNDDGDTYNLCHFWSNFEIADMNLWRSPAYQDFFNYLESTGGFYYERWGDAPIHSIAAALFARRDQIHFFDEIGYEHRPYTHCPRTDAKWKRGHCSCDQARSFDYDGYSCMRQWDRIWLDETA
ncbi:glycosyltransferase family 15 protein [Fistulina hepatica ATCC 64428]|uniref:Glycosyltransferase family 15 protein n=1 Tax=Fistulina hepatica ATCC 64428 TaxID=1128425 RepID=A0A0D7AER9_9AGAR|nr:glycosyltransferase family 15 protein [Fistulina hepatica ATCC 64428]